MSEISGFLAKQEILVFAILAGVILLAILLVAWIIHRAAKKAAEAAEIAKGEAPMEEPKEEGHHGHHGHHGVLFGSQRRSFAGWRQVRRAFYAGLNEYRQFVAHSRNVYLVPWYLVVGEVGSGKSKVLDAVGPNRPPVYLPDGESERAIGCTWWFYDEATVIEAAGESILGSPGAAHGGEHGHGAGGHGGGHENPKQAGRTGQRAWNTLLTLLRRNRPQRPIDGIILAIPVSDLVGPDRLPPHLLRQKARDLYAKLFHAQGALGLCLPIYIMLTKCDRLAGFDAFAQGLPEGLKDGMFGWSNPYPLEMPFTSPWLDEAFETMGGDLLKLHIELYAGGRAKDTGDDIFSFASNLREIRDPLADLLSTLFRRSAYHETFYFRGLYLTGDLDAARHGHDAHGAAAHGAHGAPAPAHGGGANHGGHGLAARAEPHFAGGHAAAAGHGHVVFARDLFTRKIFAERDLAKFTPSSALGFRRRKRTYRIVTGAIAAVFLFMLFNDYQKASLWSATMQPVLMDLPGEFSGARASIDAMAASGGKPSPAAKRNVAAYLDDVASLEEPFDAFLMPGSWFDPAPDLARGALAAGYYRTVLVPLYASLQQRMVALAEGREEGVRPGTEVEAFTEYVHDIRTLEAAIEVYNRLNGSGTMTGLPTLVRYTWGLGLTPAFIGKAVYYDVANLPPATVAPNLVGNSELGRVNLDNYAPIANERLKQLADAAFARLADGSLVASRLRMVADNLNTALMPGQNLDGVTGALQNALAGLHDASAQVNADNDFWTGQRSMVFSPKLNEAFEQIARSHLFGPGVEEELREKAAVRFNSMQPDYRLVNSAIGPLVSRDPNGTAKLSPSAIQLMSTLDTWFHQDFMQPTGVPQPLGLPTQAVLWDSTALAGAPGMIEHYLLFSSKTLGGVPPSLQPLVKAASLARLQFNLLNTVASARRSADTNFTPGASSIDTLRLRITSLTSAAPVLFDVMQAFQQFSLPTAYDRVHTYVRGQAQSLLGQVDDVARENQFFLPLPNVLATWQGQSITNFQMFGLTDPASLGQYFDTSRQYYANISRGLAGPVLEVLRKADGGAPGTAVMERWSQTLNDLDKYDAHAPDSSLGALTRFVTVDLASVDLTQCGKLTSSATPLFASDIFAVRLSQIENMVLSRCQAIIGQQAFAAYGGIAQAFNRDFAGQFPFAAPGAPDTTPDAAADFYQAYDQYAPTVADALKKAPQYFLSAPRVQAFIDSMGLARAFLLPTDPTQDRPAVTIDVRPRSNREAEVGGNQIIEWRITSGSSVYDNLTSPSPIPWHYGDPMTLSLRWAKDSDVTPVILGEASARAQVNDRTLTYTFNGNWSLLTMLRMLGAQPNIIGRGNGNRSVLQLDYNTRPAAIPVAGQAPPPAGSTGGVASTPGRVFVSLALQQGGPATGGATATHWVAVPPFPRAIPALTTINSQSGPYVPTSGALDMSALSATLGSLNAAVPVQSMVSPAVQGSPMRLMPSTVEEMNQQ